MIKLSETAEAVVRRFGSLERAASGLAETKDRTSRVESDVAGLRAATADGSAKVKDARRKVAGLKAELSDCCPKLKKDLANLKEEIRTMKPKPELLAPAANIAVPLPLKAGAPAMTCSNSSLPPHVAQPPPKQAKQFPPSLKKGKTGWGAAIDVSDGIIAHSTHFRAFLNRMEHRNLHGAGHVITALWTA
jgi:hypothetical protein